MKKLNYILILCPIFLLSSCYPSRYISEIYIKNKIETHNKGAFSTIRTKKLYATESLDAGNYLEFTAYKTGSHKGLVISADKYYQARKKNPKDPFVTFVISHIELNEAACQSILDNYLTLKDKLTAENAGKNEQVYYDYTVTEDFYISYSKPNLYMSSNNIDLWIKGEKYPISSNTFIEQLKSFMAY